MASLTDRETLFHSRLIESITGVELRVTDIEAALSFYSTIVGLETTVREDDRASLGARGGSPFLHLRSDGVTSAADPGATGLFHTAFRFPTRSSLGDALARLVAAGYQVAAGDHLVSEALYVDDPAGNGVELYWDRPLEEWPAPAGGMLVPMATLAVDLQGLLDEGNGRDAVGEPAPVGTDIGHVHLQVSDISASDRFYTEVLGLDLTARLGGSAGFYSANGYHHNIGANVWRSRGSEPAGREHAGLERVAFKTVEEELRSLRDRVGSERISAEADGSLVISDPDGIELRFEI